MTADTRVVPNTAAFGEEDVSNIMLMEHVNVRVPDQSLATLFYLVGMGFTRDPHMMVGLENMWVNLGEQQFHLPTGQAQVLRGHVGLVVPDLEALAGRLESVAPKLAGTKFAWSRQDGYLAVTCPWGNQYRCYAPSDRFGGIAIGTAYVEFSVPSGAAGGIAAFYRQALQAPAAVVDDAEGKAAVVEVGQYQQLIFRESKDVPDYDGHHIAIYTANFSAPYAYLAERGLITEAPRNNHQYRFKDIVDPETGKTVFTIEHEVRGLRHPLYRRPLVNRSIGQLAEPRRAGAGAFM
jgi:hypothetical protein